MKIGFLSDIHGNAIALASCIEFLQQLGVKRLYCLGDVVGYIPDGQNVMERLHRAGVQCLLGNHDAMLVGKSRLDPGRDEVYGLAATGATLTGDSMAALNTRSPFMEVHVGGRHLLLVHGSPWDPLNGYVYPDADLSTFSDLPYDAVVMGHTHFPFVGRAGKTAVVNVGSCGLPRDQGNLASLAMYTVEDDRWEIMRLSMDIEAVLRRYHGRLHESVIACLQRRSEGGVVGLIVEGKS